MSSPVHQSNIFNEICSISVYYIKFLFYGVSLTGFSMLFVILFSIMKIGHYNITGIVRRVSNMVSRVIGIKWSMKGIENVMSEGSAVVVMNHQSVLDMLDCGMAGHCALDIIVVLTWFSVIGELRDRNIFTHGVMKKELWYILPPLAAFLSLNGIVSIDRFNKKKGVETLNKVSNEMAKKEARVIIFPEGTRHGGNKLLPFKKGAFHSAIAAQVPIVPVVTRRYTFLDHKNRRFHSGEGLISVLPPIPTVGLKQENVEELMLKVQGIMSKEYDDLNSADQNLFPLSEKVK